MKKFLVTGGAGFIGSNFIRGLIKSFPNAEIRVIDNLSTGKLDNLKEIRHKIKFYKKDLRNYRQIAPIFKGIDIVFHEAAIPSVSYSILEPELSHESNIDGTFNALLASHKAGVKRFIYAASSSAYGDTPTLPKRENMSPSPKSPYALQKLVGEQYCDIFKKVFGLETVALRYFNVFGPRQNPSSSYSGVISVFMKAALEKRSPTIFGNGRQTRDFTFIDNVVNLNINAATAKKIPRTVYNAGTGQRHSLNTIWKHIQKIAGVSVAPKYRLARVGDIRDSQADITLAKKELGYKPSISLEDGLQLTYKWYRDSLKK